MLLESLNDLLESSGLKLPRFQQITTRLFAYGIILRDEDGGEQRLYDDAHRIEAVLTDYFQAGGFRLHHDVPGQFFRLYVPGASIPGLPEDELDSVPALRAKVTPDFVAAALALRFLYQQALNEGGGKLSNEGDVLIYFEELATTLQTQLRRNLPDTQGDRDRLLKDLKRHRLIHFNAGFSATDEEAMIAIRSTILGLISEDALAAALEGGEGAQISETSDNEDTPDHEA